jgi:hypothetical protein
MEWRVRCWVRATVVTSCKRQKTQTPQRTSADKTWTVVLLQSSLRCTNTNKNNRDNLRFIDKVGIQNYRRYDILILPAFAFLSVVLYGSWRGGRRKRKTHKKRKQATPDDRTCTAPKASRPNPFCTQPQHSRTRKRGWPIYEPPRHDDEPLFFIHLQTLTGAGQLPPFPDSQLI